VSEFVPQIIECVKRIIANGYAYEAQNSIYFDVSAFHEQKGHLYAKLCPWSAGNCKFHEEGEGVLGAKLEGKKDSRDFALWKASKAGEPFWDSPWGPGRPGWHIECSAMAAAVAPGVLDIHSGGIDLAFPHHDNELAQSEAFYESPQWVNYFLHAGHVHIEGHKMSKSLKNFITIKNVLSKYTSRQLRIMFLQHQWNAPVYYKEASMTTAVAVERVFDNFFANVATLVRSSDKEPECAVNEAERSLIEVLTNLRKKVHECLCDSFDTPSALQYMQELVNSTNIYIQQNNYPNAYVLKMIGKYVSRMLRIFGVIEDGSDDTIGFISNKGVDSSSAKDSRLIPILEAVAEYRDKVRAITMEKNADVKNLLQFSDQMRDSLQGFGIVFEDRPGKPTFVKLLDPEAIAQQKREAAAHEEEKLVRKLEMTRINEAKLAQKLAKAIIKPEELFRGDAAYSQWDEHGVPTHDKEGVELSKNARKKVLKDYNAQVELHQRFLNGKS